MKEESRYPLGARYCAILNAVNYVSVVLRDWGDDVVGARAAPCLGPLGAGERVLRVFQFFLQLQQAAVSLGDEAALGGLGLMELGRLAALEGSLFDGLLALLERLQGDMMGRLLDWTMRDLREKARPYSHSR